MKLTTVRDYAKAEGLSEQGARKRVASGLVKSVQLDANTYIVTADNSGEIIREYRAKVRLLNSRIKTLKAESVSVQNQADYIKRLEDRVDKLEESLDASTMKKEELYEKVINTLAIPR